MKVEEGNMESWQDRSLNFI